MLVVIFLTNCHGSLRARTQHFRANIIKVHSDIMEAIALSNSITATAGHTMLGRTSPLALIKPEGANDRDKRYISPTKAMLAQLDDLPPRSHSQSPTG